MKPHPNSRIRLKSFLFVSFLLVSSTARSQNPNVVLIYTDDQGYGDASCLNVDAKFQTPNFDRLARDGISFTDAHSNDTPWWNDLTWMEPF